ncbi:hypothetical protein C8Q77DRAFT_1073101 [Trametes polyzona]|nr:hypothetical protein C8Q77DRAFT_1073101 [Trametes polyzona]
MSSTSHSPLPAGPITSALRETNPSTKQHSLPNQDLHLESSEEENPLADRTLIDGDKPSSTGSFRVPGATEALRDLRYRLDREMHWRYVKVQDFIDRFLPGDDSRLPPDYEVPTPHVDHSQQEVHMYPGLCQFFNEVLAQIPEHDLRAFSCDTYPEQVAPSNAQLTRSYKNTRLRPDIALYPSLARAKQAYEVTKKRHRNVQETSRAESSKAPSLVSAAAALGDRASAEADSPLTEPPEDDDTTILVRTSFAWAQLIVEVKKDPTRTPFSFGSRASQQLSDGDRHRESRGQLIQYAAETFHRQHRTFLFMISIFARHARFIRFDRGGAFVSESFDYESKPDMLALFLRRFSQLTPEERGHDPTATLATDDEEELFRTLLDRLDPAPGFAVQRGLKEAAVPGWPVYALDIYAPWSSCKGEFLDVQKIRTRASHRCLVGRPMQSADSMTGRGTRIFLAWDTKEKSLCIIKDNWRAVSDDILSEFEVYQLLYRHQAHMAKGGRFTIPTLRGGGDVLQRLPTPSLASTTGGDDTSEVDHLPGGPRSDSGTPGTSDPGERRPLEGRVWQETLMHRKSTLPRRHCRLVLQEVCRPLVEFANPQELVWAILLALSTHRTAWEKAGILHRDVSVGNILLYDDITENGEERVQVLLSDWDLAKTKEQLGRKATQRKRSGTWQFTSALLQCYPKKRYELSDDLESFVHVLNWCTLKYLPHDMSGLAQRGSLSSIFANHFDDAFQNPTESHQRNEKLLAMQQGTMIARPFWAFGDSEQLPLTTLLRELAEMCKAHYDTVDVEQLADLKFDSSVVLAPPREPVPKNSKQNMDAQIASILEEFPDSSDFTPPARMTAASPKTSPWATHKPMLQAFLKAYQGVWPETYQKTSDQLPHVVNRLKTADVASKRTLASSEDSIDSRDERPLKQARHTSRDSREPKASPGPRGRRGLKAAHTSRLSRDAPSRQGSRPGSRPGSLPPSEPEPQSLQNPLLPFQSGSLLGSPHGSHPVSRAQSRLTPQLRGLGIDSRETSRAPTPDVDDIPTSDSEVRQGKPSNQTTMKGKGKGRGTGGKTHG